MPADQRFAERIKRIETGKQWIPDGVVVSGNKTVRKKGRIARRQRRVSMVLSLIVMWGLGMVFVQQQPELADRMMAGDFGSMATMLEGLPGLDGIKDG